ncbi:MAG: RNB domain-containing ribonuclease [Enhygromyxa sp.]
MPTAVDPSQALRASLREAGVELDYPEAVLAEVEAWQRAPGVDDSSLDDRTALPFVTVDGPGTRDLDQALHVERRGDGFAVQFAVADAAYFVRPGSALLEESLRRGASYYLPGEAVPMLPRPLSEDLVSLGPGVDRRAMVFDMRLDAAGRCTDTQVVRARIRSRQQLTFDEVEAVVSGRQQSRITDPGIVASLMAMRAVGQRLAELAEARGVVPYHRSEVRVRLSSELDARLTAVEVARSFVEADNAQLSLLCNSEGARILRDQVDAGAQAQPIYRVHPPPDDDSLAQLEASIAAAARAHQLDGPWRWDRSSESLAEFIRRLPSDDAHARLLAALSRQAIMINVRSTYAGEPGPHHGVGTEVYARFSAPMREVVGVFLHKEMWELLTGEGDEPGRDEALREQVIAAANRSRALQSQLSRAADQLVIDALFTRDLAQPTAARPAHRGTLMGMRRGRAYVRLDDPPLDVKVYIDRLERGYGCDEHGVVLTRTGRAVARLGDVVAVRVVDRASNGRWMLDFA